jgi:cytoskeletal protein RodZ
MAITQSRLFPQRERGNLLSRSIRLVAFTIVATLTLETTSLAGAQQGPAPTQPSVPSQEVRQPSTQPAANSTDAAARDARNEPADSLPSAPEPAQQAPAQQPPAQQPATPQQPVGTAAAPYEKPTGVPGSKPAGAAIAPAKQRRVRAIVIRVGIVLAAGAAVGAVVGLSKATHSAPQ